MALDDHEAIRGTVRQWEQAWNAGDMSAAMELFSDDADFINVWGSHWHSRRRIESEHAQRHRLQLKDSVFSASEVKVQQIVAGVALVHFGWIIRGDRNLDGTARQPRRGLFTWVLLKDTGGRWWVRAAHNTHVATAP
jgi:uncharacterized protein (TIGR02246 family)